MNLTQTVDELRASGMGLSAEIIAEISDALVLIEDRLERLETLAGLINGADNIEQLDTARK